MSEIIDNEGRVILSVRIGRPVDKIRDADPNDLKHIDHTNNNELLVAIVENNYSGIVTIRSGEKWEIKVVAERLNGRAMLLTQTKLHSERTHRGLTLKQISAIYVEIMRSDIPSYQYADDDFPSL